MAADMVNHPPHYTSHPSGVECINVVEHMSFNIGNAIKYMWRIGHKWDDLEDLKKAAWYLNREIERLVAAGPDPKPAPPQGDGDTDPKSEPSPPPHPTTAPDSIDDVLDSLSMPA